MTLPLHLITSLAFLIFTIKAFAGNAAWLANPISGDWNSVGNWTAGGPPNGAADVATFDFSSVTAISLSANTEANAIQFSSGASPFTITVGGPLAFTLSGAGISNDSGMTQTLVAGGGGTIVFVNHATAADATLLANGGGSSIKFKGSSTGGSARVEVFGNGNLDISAHNISGVTIGSIEGNGTVFLGANSLSIGNNNLSTLFSGMIQDGGAGGSLRKIGSGTLTLTSANVLSGYIQVEGGALHLENGGSLSNRFGSIGGPTGINCVAVVDGAGTVWNNQHSLSVADGGTGALTIQNGGTVLSETGSVGNLVGSNGTVLVDGAGSSWTAPSGIFIGNEGNGSLTVRNGGKVEGVQFIGSSARGVVLVDGVGSAITHTGYLLIGGGGRYAGVGSLMIQNGASVTNAAGFLGNFSNGYGIVLVDGPGSKWTNNGELDVGTLGRASLTIQDGGSVSNLKATIASVNGSEGTVNVTGLGSTWTNSDLFVGGGESVPGGTGLLRITNGGTVNATTVRIFSHGTVIDDSTLVSPNVIVAPSGLLTGHGTVSGNIQNGGIISPGNSPGVLSINGNYDQTATGTLRIEIAGLTLPQHDLLAVSSSAFLDGNLEVVLLNGFSFQRDEVITILTTGGAVNGTFAAINGQPSTGTILDVRAIYNSNSVSLVLVQGSFASLAGLTPNQMAVGGMLDRISDDPEAAPLIELLDTQRVEVLPAAFDRIAPEELTAIFEIGISTAAVQSYNIENRLEEIRAGSNGFSSTLSLLNSRDLNQGSGKEISDGQEKGVIEQATGPQVSQNRWGFFVSGSGEFVNVDSDFNARGYDFESGGVSLGLDYRLSERLAIGLTGGYLHTNTDLADGGDIEANGGKLGIYATWFSAGAYLNGFVEGGFNNYKTQRSALLGLARGETDGAEFNALFGGGYDFKFGNCTVGPTASLQYSSVHIDSFDETGSFVPLTIDSQNEDALGTRLGAHFSYRCELGRIIVRPQIGAEWQHEFLDRALAIDSSIAGIPGSSFTVHGPAHGRDSAVLSAGITVQCSARMQAFADYRAEVGRDNYDQQSVTGGLRVEF